MAQCYSTIDSLLRKQNAHWPPDNITPSDYYTILARSLDFISFDQFHNSKGCGRNKCRHTCHHPANVDSMKPINIFTWIDRFDYFVFGDMFWQRKLNDKSVNT